jgi:hypothetical protein
MSAIDQYIGGGTRYLADRAEFLSVATLRGLAL